MQAIRWDAETGELVLLDQTLLPGQTAYRRIRRTDELVDAIHELAVRGAPALGVVGAFGVVIAMDQAVREDWSSDAFDRAVAALRHARPTAVNLAWGVDRAVDQVAAGRDAVLATALDLQSADVRANRELSRQAADWLCERLERPTFRVLTHCNTGDLATAGWGTALGVVRELNARGRLGFVYADETRPLLQGARLTAFELAHERIAHAVCADGAAAGAILGGLVDVAIVGADRIAANGDTANKVGTLGVALACHAAGVPFIVAAPWSTVDLDTATGADIEVEQRAADEVTRLAGVQIAPPESAGYNPAFDVTPARYIDGIATERGVLSPPLAPA